MLPKGWEVKKLGDVTLETGNLSPEKEPEKIWTYIDISSIDRNKLAITDPKNILGKDAPSRAKKHIQTGDVLFATTRPNLKNIAIFDLMVKNPVASTGFCVLRPSEQVLESFLFYFVITDVVQKQIEPFISGASYPAVTDKNLKKVAIPIPPLPEQQRIVEILDEAFAGIDTAIGNTQQAINNAKELFDTELNRIFSQRGEGWEVKVAGMQDPTQTLPLPGEGYYAPPPDKGEAGRGSNASEVNYVLPNGWEVKKLREIAEYFNGLTYSPKDVSDIGTVVLRSSNIQSDDLDFSDIVRVSVNVKEKLYVKDGDILMCSRNGSKRLVGKTALISNLDEPMTFGTFMMIVRSEYNSYLLWFFKTVSFKKQISGGENTMINQVTRYMLDEVKIPIPPLPEQQRIVAKLDQLKNQTQALTAVYQQKLAALQELKQSLLHKAFTGELSTKWRELE
jgi:type I restriction enzyme S subunit